MCICCLKRSFELLCRLILVLSFFVSLTVSAAKGRAPEAPALSDLDVAKYLQDSGGGYADLFVKLKERDDFLRLCEKYKLDDPAAWSALRSRFLLKLSELQRQLGEAKSMMATPDARSGLSNEVVSSEKIRSKGSALYNKLSLEANEFQQSLRLIGEIGDVLEQVSLEYALTADISLESKTGQSLMGQVLFVDGNDLIIKRQDAGYFRIPSHLLSESTKLNLMNLMFSSWEALPEMCQDDDVKNLNSGELIAFSDTHLYIKDRFEGFVPQKRSDSQFVFVPYEEQIEAFKAANLDKKKNRLEREAELETLQKALALNLERVETIAWYASRLEVTLPESERKQSKAYREEKVNSLEPETAKEASVVKELEKTLKEASEGSDSEANSDGSAEEALVSKVSR